MAAERFRVLMNLALLASLVCVASGRPRWRPAAPPPLAGRLLIAEALGVGDDERRAELLERAVLLAGEDARGPNELALLLERIGRPAEALAAVDRALALEPDAAPLHFNRGSILLARGESGPAILAFTRAIELAPSASAYLNRGSARYLGGAVERSIEDFQRAIELAPDDSAAFHSRAIALLALGRQDEAVSDLQEAARRDPGSPAIQKLLERLTGR